jgi:hypothetical protein
MKHLLLCLGCTLALATHAQPGPLSADTMEREGQALAARLRSLRPAEGVTNMATLRIRTKTNTVEVPMRIEVSVTESNWSTRYLTLDNNEAVTEASTLTQTAGTGTEYLLSNSSAPGTTLFKSDAFAPFAGSDFWLADLGMEFLHWPTQRLLKKEIRRGQSCDKLESLAPTSHTNGYVRVVSWFDIDTGGPVICEAYDAKGKMVKEFKPNDFTKVDGQWRVEELEMRDLRTGSRSFIRFNLKD